MSQPNDHPTDLPGQTQDDQPGREHEMDPKPQTIYADWRGSGKLDGKVALITGGDSGIGRAVSVLFAREGADVSIVYLEETEDAETTRQAVEAEGRRCLTIRADVQSEEACRDAVQRTVDEFGGLNVLVNNAAWQVTQESITDISSDQLDRTFRTNIYAYSVTRLD